MKRTLEVALLTTLVGIGIAALVLINNNSERERGSSGITEKEISLRNMTKSRIHYRVKLDNTFIRAEEKVIKPGEIHYYSSGHPLKVTFERIGAESVRHLVPGTPYNFRRDENDLVEVYQGAHGRADAVDLAPFVATPAEVVEKMLELAEVDEDDVVYDIGCGDGRIIIMAAQKYGAHGVGIDIDPQRIEESKDNAKNAGIEHLVKFYLGDATTMNVSQATVVALYLLPESNALLRPQLEKQLIPGVYVVTHNYRIPGWEEREVRYTEIQDQWGKNHSIFLYER